MAQLSGQAGKTKRVFRFRTIDLGSQSIEVTDILPLEPLNSRLTLGASGGSEINVKKAPEVSLKIYRTAQGAQIDAKISFISTQSCGRCGEDLERQLETEMSIHYIHVTPLRGEPLPEDDIGVSYFSGEHIVLDEHLEEAIILAIDPFYLPDLDTHGKCSH